MYKIEYWSDCQIGYIPADTHFYMWIDGVFLESEEILFEEGTENANKVFYPTFQKSTKQYKLESNLIGDTQLDTLRSIKYFNHREITYPTGETYEMNNYKCEDPEWPFDNPSYPIAKITFDIGEEILIRSSCCIN